MRSRALPAARVSKRRVIIDQDTFGPGGPNLQPILMALNSADVDVLGITVESGDGWQRENVAHALRMLERVGRTDVPVVPGATFPLINSAAAARRWEGQFGKLFYKGAWTEAWPPEVMVRRAPVHPPEVVPPSPAGKPRFAPARERAAEFLIRQVHRFPGEVSVVALGPATNLALAIRLDDTLAATARELVVMGGSFQPRPANGAFALEYAHAPRREFNFWWDPEAASIMLRAPWPRITQVPIDPTTSTFFTPAMIRTISAARSRTAKYLAPYLEGFPLWDELATALWLDPGLATRRETLAVDVDVDHGAGYGNTLSWPVGHGPGLGEREVSVVFEVDVPRLNALVLDRLTR